MPRGAQIFDSYGKKFNSCLFLNYGFISLDKDTNDVELKICLDPDQKNF